MEGDSTNKENQGLSRALPLSARDVIKIEKPKIYSTIGKTIESGKPSAPMYSFGRAERKDTEKVFCSKALVKTQFICKESPGPAYNPSFAPMVKSLPKYSFGTQKRAKSAAPTYEYFNHEDTDFDPNYAKLKVKKTTPVIKFKSNPRVS